MRVALVSRFAWPSVGGIQMLVRTLASSLVADGTQIEIFAHRIDNAGINWLGHIDRAAPFEPQVDAESGVITTQLRLSEAESVVLRGYARLRGADPRFERLHARVATRRFATQLARTDLIHRFGGNRMALATVQAARRLDRPVVVTPLAHAGVFDDDELSARAYRAADLVVATTNADAEIYRGLGVATDRVQVCPLPTVRPGPGDGRRVRSTHRIEGPLVVFLGVRRENKRIPNLLDAADILAERDPSVRVAVVGRGEPLRAHGPAIVDVGAVSEDDRNAWLHAADVVCLPSSDESYGLVVSEAWSLGVPVVTSDIPVLRERVAASGGGIATSVDPPALAAALHRLVSDAELRRRMGQAGRVHWERTESPESVAAWHRASYVRLLEARGRPAA